MTLAKKVAIALRDTEKPDEEKVKLRFEVVDLAARLREKVRQYKDIREAFRRFDEDKSGSIDRDEFHQFCRSYHFTHDKDVVDDLFSMSLWCYRLDSHICVLQDLMDVEKRDEVDFDAFAKGLIENKTLLSQPHPGESVRPIVAVRSTHLVTETKVHFLWQ